MTRRTTGLYGLFRPKKYVLVLTPGKNRQTLSAKLALSGKKMGPPSKRITLCQSGLKVNAAKIVRRDKKGLHEYDIARINNLPSFEQVRLHTKEILYPGDYEISLHYELSQQKVDDLRNLGDKKPGRELLPSVDEPEAWTNADLEIR